MNERPYLKRNEELLRKWNAAQTSAIEYLIMQGFLSSDTDPRIADFGERFRSFMEVQINILSKKIEDEVNKTVSTTQKTFDQVIKGA